MAVKGRKPAADAPAHPGRAIVERVLGPFALTQEQLAKLTGVSRRTINQLVNRRRNLTADMALRIARVTGSDARLWMERQIDWDLWQAANEGAGVLASLQPLVPEAALDAPAADEPAGEPPPPDVLAVKKLKKPKDDKKAKKTAAKKSGKKKKK